MIHDDEDDDHDGADDYILIHCDVYVYNSWISLQRDILYSMKLSVVNFTN